MEDSKEFKFKYSMLLLPFLLVFLIWFVYWLELKLNSNFNSYGILPRKIRGLKGILFSPFIHGSTSHIINNSLPLFVLLTGLLFFYNKIAIKVLVIGTLFTGLSTWFMGRESYHIGASGVIYFLFSFIFFSGIIRKHFRLISFSLVIVFLYGSMIWYVFPIKQEISWEGHLSGFLVGLSLAILFRKFGPQKPTYIFKKTDFDNHFDESGNFIDENNFGQEDIKKNID